MQINRVARFLLAVWVAVWLIFLIRPYIKKDLLREYSELLHLSAEGKRSYITGEELYDFLKFCNKSIKSPATYRIIGLEEAALEKRRAIYYLYPNREDSNPEFLFIYKVNNFQRDGYCVFKFLDSNKLILRKIK